ncbi:MAG: dUTP diphosphatase [Hyphomicrobium sp.]|nr:dUTP diphosphatase [Hyphomicrobium sp.]
MAKDKSSKKRLKVRVKVLPHGKGLPLPSMQSDGAAGLDLVAAVNEKTPLRIARGKWALVPTGLSLELPRGVEAQVRPRSGLAMKHGVTVLNSPGTIDSDYRGEVQVLLVNLGERPFLVKRGERIAQMVVAAHADVKIKPVEDLSDTRRGSGGFGSTGKATSVAGPAKKKAVPKKASRTRTSKQRKRA